MIEDVQNVICLGPEQRRPESDRPLLVVVVAIPTPTPVAFMQSIHSLREALQSLGLDSIIINNVEFVALVDQPRTFVTAKNPGDKGCKVIADGVEQHYVMWAESTSGLVCLRESGNPANVTVKRFKSVVFEHRKAQTQI